MIDDNLFINIRTQFLFFNSSWISVKRTDEMEFDFWMHALNDPRSIKIVKNALSTHKPPNKEKRRLLRKRALRKLIKVHARATGHDDLATVNDPPGSKEIDIFPVLKENPFCMLKSDSILSANYQANHSRFNIRCSENRAKASYHGENIVDACLMSC